MDIALHALAEPRRRDILRLIYNQELSSGDIASHFEVSGPAISQHLKVLVDARLVTMRKQGTKRLYQARPEGLAEVRAYLDGFWEDNLQQLKMAAEAEERRSTRRGPVSKKRRA